METIGHNTRKADIYTHEFERAHGRKPSWVAKGWAFTVRDASAQPGKRDVEMIWAPGDLKFGPAREWARDEVARRFADALATGNLYLEVAP